MVSCEARALPCFVFVIAVALVAACGGGGGGGSAPEGSLLALSTFQPASLVLGQPDFAGFMANQGGAASATTMTFPVGLADGGLWLADGSNSRVLHFPTPLTNPMPDLVVGQPDFTMTTPAVTAASFLGPSDPIEAEGKLAVSDFGAHRVLIWNSIPTTNGAAADVVVGQTDFISSASGATASNLTNPAGVSIAAGRLFVCDWANSRVLIWHTVPTSNGTAADLVLGQPNFTSNAFGDGANQMRNPRGLWTDGTRLVVVEQHNHRALIWNSFPSSNGQPADLVLGQPGFGSSASGTSASSLNQPDRADCNGTQLVISDLANHRVLIWNTFPATNGQPADVVLGQSDFNHVTANDDDQNAVMDAVPTARTFNGPAGVLIDGARLFVSDFGNHRLLVFGP